MMLPELPKKGRRIFKHLVDWPGFAIADDKSIWKHDGRSWWPIKPKRRGRHKIVALRLAGSYADCRVDDLYEETFNTS